MIMTASVNGLTTNDVEKAITDNINIHNKSASILLLLGSQQ